MLSLLFLMACEPLHDLDAASSGGDGALTASGSPSTAASGNSAGMTAQPGAAANGNEAGDSNWGGRGGIGGMPNTAGTPSGSGGTLGTGMGIGGGAGSTKGGAAGVSGDPEAGSGGQMNGAGAGGDGSDPGAAGEQPDAGAAGAAGTSTVGMGDAPELPLDLPGIPVEGTFTVASDAQWEVDGAFLPTFEIRTPTASYWVVKDLGMIVSIVDVSPNQRRQWLNFSSGWRPLRGLPSFETFADMEKMTTTLDVESQTPTHVRLYSESESGVWRIVYDFYPTHVTLTVNAAPTPYGLAYRGVPGGELESTDQFVRADGRSQSAVVSSVVDLSGPAEWAYLSDPELGRSLLMIHHADDELVDRYQVKDNDSAMLSFGDGELFRLPARFSFGLIESADHQEIASRADFIIEAID